MAFPVPPKTWSAGETLTAADFNAQIRDALDRTMHTLARKSADQTVNNSTTLVNDTHLSFAVSANEVWLVEAWLKVDTGSTPDIKFGWTVPAAASIQWGYLSGDYAGGTIPGWMANVGVATALATTGVLVQQGSGAGVIIGAAFVGIATIAGTAGTVQLQWAQNTLNASDTKVLINSALIGCRLA